MRTKAGRQRRRYALLSELSVFYEGYSDEVPVRPPDISPQGLFINTPRHFPVGAVLKIRFRLSRSGVEVEARAEVRYCLAGVGIGVEFLDISPEYRSAIEEELRIAGLHITPEP